MVAVTQNVNSVGLTDILPQYLEALKVAGAETKLIPYTESIEELRPRLEECDGVCITGGIDVHLKRYGEEKTHLCGETYDKRDVLDLTVFHISSELNKPILGICRGAQLIMKNMV